MKINVKKLIKDPDVQGWAIWIVLTIVMIPPCIWIMFNYTYNTATLVTRYMLALFAAAIGAGFISWALNEAMFRIGQRGREKERKATKKAAKKTRRR